MGDILDEALEEIPIHKTRPWVSAWIVNLSEISPNTSTFRARFEFNVFWYLSDEDEKSYKAAIREKTIRDWEPTWQPNFIPVNVSSLESTDREVFANGKSFVVSKKDGRLIGRYVMLLDAVFTELFELKLFPYDVQDLSMDLQYHSYPQAYQPLIPDADGDIDLSKSQIKIHEKCLSSAEWIFHSVQLGFGVWKQQLRINVKLERRWKYYVYRVIFVLGLVTLASCFTCFIPSDTIDGQLGYLSACLLACVAYLYVVGEALPKLPFLTILDLYTFACILYVGVLMIKACILSFMHVGLRENANEILAIFAVDLMIWILIHVIFMIKSLLAKRESAHAVWQFPGALVFKQESTAATLGNGGKVAPGGCVAFLDSECKREELMEKGLEVYQKMLPKQYADIINK